MLGLRELNIRSHEGIFLRIIDWSPISSKQKNNNTPLIAISKMNNPSHPWRNALYFLLTLNKKVNITRIGIKEQMVKKRKKKITQIFSIVLKGKENRRISNINLQKNVKLSQKKFLKWIISFLTKPRLVMLKRILKKWRRMWILWIKSRWMINLENLKREILNKWIRNWWFKKNLWLLTKKRSKNRNINLIVWRKLEEEEGCFYKQKNLPKLHDKMCQSLFSLVRKNIEKIPPKLNLPIIALSQSSKKKLAPKLNSPHSKPQKSYHPHYCKWK